MESVNHALRLAREERAEFIALVAHINEKRNPGLSLVEYGYLLFEILKNSSSPFIDDLNLSRFQSSGNGIIYMSNFFGHHSWYYSLEQTERLYSLSESHKNPTNRKILDIELALRYIKDYLPNYYQVLAPIFLFYCGGAPAAFLLIDNLDDESELSSMSQQLYYYYYRSGVYVNQSKDELESIKNAATRLIESNPNPSEEDIYYYNLLIDYNDHYEKEGEFPKYALPRRTQLFNEDTCETINDTAITSFLRAAEKTYIETQLIEPAPIWDAFEITPAQKSFLYKRILDKEVVSIEDYFHSADSISRMNWLMLFSKTYNSSDRMIIELLENMSDKELEHNLILFINSHPDSPEEMLLLSYYLYLKGITEKIDTLSTTDFLSILFYCGSLQKNIVGTDQKIKRLSPLKKTTFVQSLNLAGVFDSNLLIITGLISSAILILDALAETHQINDNKDQKLKRVKSYAEYLTFKTELIQQFKKDSDIFGMEFYTRYPVFEYFSRIKQLVSE